MIILNSIMKVSDLNSMSILELKNKLSLMKEEYQKLKMQNVISAVEKSIQIRYIRRDIARIKTVINKKT